MKIIIVFLPIISIIFGILNGNIGEISSSVLDKAGQAVNLVISLCGIMCLWCGLMKVAEKSGLVEKISNLLSPAVGALFKGIEKNGKAARYISMNITANLLGLGNASTPLGIKAMEAIAEEDGIKNGEASDNMIMLTVLNTASLQIIPTTVAALRAARGSENPMEILPCVWIVSIYALAAAVGAAKILGTVSKWRKKDVVH